MPEIRIQVTNKIATNLSPGEVIVCGNSDYEIVFLFDEEWDAEPTRTARFTYLRNGQSFYKECTFEGSFAPVPILSGIREVQVGVYAGELHTTTPARVICKPSILCGNAVEQITPAEKAGLQTQVDKLTLEVDDLKENGAGGAQPDWNQNDSTAPDYIKNRPFHDNAPKWVCVQEPQTIEVVKSSEVVTGELGYCLNYDHFLHNEYPDGTVFKLIVGGDEYVGTYKVSGYANYVGNGALYVQNEYHDYPDTGEDFLIYYYGADSITIVTRKPLTACEVSVYMHDGEETKKIDPKYLPKPLLLNADSTETYLNDSSYGDEALEAIKTGRQILVRVPNADGGTYTAIYSPVMMYQVPNRENKYLYLFFLRDEKTDLTQLFGYPMQMPTYGQLKMLLSQEYNSNPLEA